MAACDNQVKEATPLIERLQNAQFVDEKACISCHKQEFRQWQGSHHDLAMDSATVETVLGDFNQRTFSSHGITSTFFKRDGKFLVNTDGKDGKLQDFEVDYVFGVTPLQQYLIKFPDGRMQALDIAWDSREKAQGGQRWFHLHPDENINAKHPFHWTKQLLNWNFMCAECHSTDVKKNFDLKHNTFNTSWSKVDIGCQACHGPASNHLNWIKKKDSPAWDNMRGFAVDLNAKQARVQVESCARCHARRSNVSNKYEYGKPLMDFYQPQILRQPFYHPDGQIKDEVYVYGSFVQSKMHAQGVRCTDCHNAHTARLKLSGNKLCISCHNSAGNARFGSLKKQVYDTPKHHFHAKGSKGSLCVSCHMPEKTYMGVDARKDHSFRTPRPDLSVKIGVPNACTQCHQNKPDQWAANKLAKWYPTSAERYQHELHFSEVFAAAQSPTLASKDTAKHLMAIALDESQAEIIQATAVSLLAAYPSLKVLDALKSLLHHDADLIRYHAIHSLDVLVPQAAGEVMLRRKLDMVAPLLNDPIRAVRTEAARALSDVPKAMFASAQYPVFQQALKEYNERQNSIADRPEAHLNMALVHQRMGDVQQAERAYKTAIRLVADDIPARFNLANLYHSQGLNDKAEKVFREIIAMDANNGEAYYSLGLLLAELHRLPEAAPMLKSASRLLPDRLRVRYNYALTLKKLGKHRQALNTLLQIADKRMDDAMMVYVFTTWLAEAKRYDEAIAWAKKLIAMVPDEDGAKHLLINIRNQKLRQESKSE